MSADELESLIATGGRLVELPAAVHSLDRPVLVTRSDLTLDGRGATLACSENHDGLVFCPPGLLAPPGCWVPDDATGRQTFRTFGYAALSFRGTPLDLGPVVLPGVGYRNPRGWGGVRRLQVDLRVRRNGSDWSVNCDLAGMRGPTAGTLGPWVVQVWEGSVRLLWRDAAGQTRDITGPLPLGGPEVLDLTFRLDLDAGTRQAVVNGVTTAGSVPVWLALDGDQLGHAVVGNVTDGGLPAAGPDLTYLGFRVSLGWPSFPVGQEWFAAGPDTLFVLPFTDPAGAFCRWQSGAAGAGHPSYSGASGYGLAVVRAEGEPRTAGVQVRDLLVALPGSALYGFGVRAFPVLDFSLRDVRLECGAAGVALPFGHTNSYPVTLDGLTCLTHGLAGVWADRAILRGRDWTVKYARRNAVLARESAVRLDGLFYAASQNYAEEPVEDVVRLDRCERVELAGVTPNFEGSAPRRSYYRLSPSADFPTRAVLSFCSAERADGPLGLATAVRLDGPATGKAGRCTLVETPPVFAGPPVSKAAGWE